MSDAQQVFRILGNDQYAICAGVHVTPGANVSGTSDLVNAQLVFGLNPTPSAPPPSTSASLTHGYLPTPVLLAARLTYTGDAITTKVGTRSITMNSLDLSYDSTPADWVPPQYALDNNIPLDCNAALTGKVNLSIQGVAGLGNVATAGAEPTLNTILGIGKSCIYADVTGSVSIPISGNSTILLKELHFASGPRSKSLPRDKNKPAPVKENVTGIGATTVWYTKANVEINVGQGGIALHDAGFEEYDGVVRTSGGADYGRTVQMNAGWIISGLTGFFAGLLSHGL
jgi:hypothetical protein